MVDQYWIDNYPQYFGDKAKDPDEGNGDMPLDDALVKKLESIEGFGSLFNTWSERHSFITGITIGLTLKEMVNVPVPVFWYSEAHYFKSGVVIGYMAQHVDISILEPIIISMLSKKE